MNFRHLLQVHSIRKAVLYLPSLPLASLLIVPLAWEATRPVEALAGTALPPNQYIRSSERDILIAQASDSFTIAFENQCSSTSLDIAINFKNMNDQWETKYWFNFSPGERARLSNVVSRNSIFYYFAKSTDGSGREWRGNDYTATIDGRSYGMKKASMGDRFVNWTQSLSCSGERPPSLRPPTTSEARGESYKDIGGGWAGGTAVLYRNGSLIVNGRAVSNANNSATYAAMFVVGVDSRGRALFVSNLFNLPTACGQWDPTCSSDRSQSFQQSINSDLATYVDRLDVFVTGRDQPGGWQRWRTNIREAVNTWNDLPPEVKAAAAAAAAGGG